MARLGTEPGHSPVVAASMSSRGWTTQKRGIPMNNEADVKRLDDTALLLQRQEAADKGDHERKLALDAEVIRRWGHLRSLGGEAG
jgi:hypothetical protein